MRLAIAGTLLLFACASRGPKPLPQNPSPMVENTRVHGRVQQRPLAGKHFTVRGELPQDVEVEVTPAAESAKEADVVIHFLGASWLPMQAAEDSGRPIVVAAVNLGAGSARYSQPFQDPSVFPRLVEAIKAQSPPIRAIYLSGFSAGYGAIREIITQRPDDIAGVLLIDGLHTGYIPDRKVVAEGGKLDESKLMPFLRYAERAARGEKRMVITHSEIFPGTFASTTETTDWLLAQLGIKRTPVVQWGPHGMQQLSEARKGSLVVIGFAGNSAPDHIDQLHGIATFLTMLLPTVQSAFCMKARERDVCEQLIAVSNRDQDVRRRWIATGMKDNTIKAEVARTDQEDLAAVEQIIAKYGWPGKSLVGEGAASVAWTVVQHADLATQKKYLDMMTRAADAGELDPGLLATTVDRIRVREGKPQVYGTQFHEVNGVYVPQPIEDEANVDARRAKVGLGTLEEYAKELGETYGKPASPHP